MEVEKQFRTLHWRNWKTGEFCKPYLTGSMTREFYIIVGRYKIGYWWTPAHANIPWFRGMKTWGWDGFRYWSIILLKQELRLYAEKQQWRKTP